MKLKPLSISNVYTEPCVLFTRASTLYKIILIRQSHLLFTRASTLYKIILIRQTQLLTPHFFSTNEKDFQTIKDFQRYTFSANVSVTTSLLTSLLLYYKLLHITNKQEIKRIPVDEANVGSSSCLITSS